MELKTEKSETLSLLQVGAGGSSVPGSTILPLASSAAASHGLLPPHALASDARLPTWVQTALPALHCSALAPTATPFFVVLPACHDVIADPHSRVPTPERPAFGGVSSAAWFADSSDPTTVLRPFVSTLLVRLAPIPQLAGPLRPSFRGHFYRVQKGTLSQSSNIFGDALNIIRLRPRIANEAERQRIERARSACNPAFRALEDHERKHRCARARTQGRANAGSA
jgi:hypothetical protein